MPVEPEDLEQINIEDLIVQNLANNDKKLELLDEKSMGEGMMCALFIAMYLTLILIAGVCHGASSSQLVLNIHSPLINNSNRSS